MWVKGGTSVSSIIILLGFVIIINVFSMNDAYGNHFTSEHENHPHDLVSVGHTNLNEGIDYEQTCDEDSQFIIETLPDGRKNPNYLHDEFSAYVFIVAGWGGFGLSGLQTDQREDREELINFLYDNNAH